MENFWHCRDLVVRIRGSLGVVEEEALADLLLVDGNPLEIVEQISEPAKNFIAIMKDGKFFMNLLKS